MIDGRLEMANDFLEEIIDLKKDSNSERLVRLEEHYKKLIPLLENQKELFIKSIEIRKNLFEDCLDFLNELNDSVEFNNQLNSDLVNLSNRLSMHLEAINDDLESLD